MKNLRDFKLTGQLVKAIICFLFSLSIKAQDRYINPLDNADKGLVFTNQQQDELTERLTVYWTNKLTNEKAKNQNYTLTDELTRFWNQKLTDKLSSEIQDKLTPNLTEKWNSNLSNNLSNKWSKKYDSVSSNMQKKLTASLNKKWNTILIKKYPDIEQFYRKSHKEHNFKIFPNPAGDFIKVFNKKWINKTVEIFSLNGQKILETKISIAGEIDIKSLKKGLFFIKTPHGETVKFIKK